MPDWTYRTLLKPGFDRLPDDTGRRFVNGFLGRMCVLPGGSKVIDLMGHMAPSAELRTSFLGLTLSGPLLLAPAVDPSGQAAGAFRKFGFGGLVVGPVSLEGGSEGIFRKTGDGCLRTGQGAKCSLEGLSDLREADGVKVLAEFLYPEEPEELISALAEKVDGLILSPQSYDPEREEESLKRLATLAQKFALPLALGLPDTVTPEEAVRWGRACESLGLGLYICGHSCCDGQWEWGNVHTPLQSLVATLKAERPGLQIAVDPGLLEPIAARGLIEAGADVLLLSNGLVHTGPGLPKRVNDLVMTYRTPESPTVQNQPVERLAWFWAAVLGLSLLVGAWLAGWVAMTDVVLPYDEEFCGKTGPEIAAFNPRILSFMTHDRITLSGTMVSVGFLYIALAYFEIRRGSHWAQRAVQMSAVSGFISFFAFLGYGYFDPFHAMVAAILCQFLIQLSVQPTGPECRTEPSQSWYNDRIWRQALWAQLLFVIHAAALILAGVTILTFGVTEVFVPQDIEYLGMNVDQLTLFDPQLKALIAHDRATFGGMLVSAGIAILLTTLWGFRKGDAWMWWTYLIVMIEPYLLTLWIHRSIGYWNLFHLAPVYIGLILLLAGLVLSRRYFLS